MGEGLRWPRLLLCEKSQASMLERDSKQKSFIYSTNFKN